MDYSNSVEEVLGYVKVRGKVGWKPAMKVCPRIVSVLSHTACCPFNSFTSLGVVR